jgi:type VI protein secretion system component VasF
MNHTPGPWIYFSGTRGIFGANEKAICTLHGPRHTRSAERDANALLIAAATDLLAALQAIQQACDDTNGSDSGESLALRMARRLPAARAAIAKATGDDRETSV